MNKKHSSECFLVICLVISQMTVEQTINCLRAIILLMLVDMARADFPWRPTLRHEKPGRCWTCRASLIHFLSHQLPQPLFSLMVDTPERDMDRKRFNFCQICRWQKNKLMKHFCFQGLFQFFREHSRGSTSKMHLVIFSTYLDIFISDEPTWTLARTTSMGLVTVEAVAAARGPAMACSTRWGQLLGASLESCSVQHQRDRYQVNGMLRLIGCRSLWADIQWSTGGFKKRPIRRADWTTQTR